MSRKLILQDFVPYLLNRAGLRIGLMFSRDIERYDVTLPMWRVMIELWHNGDHRLGELSERTSIDLSTLSRLLVAMQRKHLIVRRRSGLDGRALSLALTERGLELTEKIAPVARHYEDIAVRGLSAAYIGQLKKSLRSVYTNLETADRAAAQVNAKERSRIKRNAQAPKRARRIKASA
jgi:DNA-binding MarR family transcriptional regulator